MVDHVLRYALLDDIDHARTVNRLVAAAPEATKHKHVELIVIAPEASTDDGIGDLLDFEPERAAHRIAEGREQARVALDRWRRGEDVDGD